eukprot:1156863-Pelagomonas_calceolata.AAC.5
MHRKIRKYACDAEIRRHAPAPQRKPASSQLQPARCSGCIWRAPSSWGPPCLQEGSVNVRIECEDSMNVRDSLSVRTALVSWGPPCLQEGSVGVWTVGTEGTAGRSPGRLCLPTHHERGAPQCDSIRAVFAIASSTPQCDSIRAAFAISSWAPSQCNSIRAVSAIASSTPSQCNSIRAVSAIASSTPSQCNSIRAAFAIASSTLSQCNLIRAVSAIAPRAPSQCNKGCVNHLNHLIMRT